MRKIFSILALSLLIITTGCRTQRHVVTTEASTDISAHEVFAQLVAEPKAYTDVYVPVTISLNAPMNVSLSGRATIVRDKEIHISLRVLGMEVAVLYVNNDALYVVDKYHKIYFTERLDKLLGDTPVSIGNVQDLLLGRLFMPGVTEVSRSDASAFNLAIDGPRLTIAPKTSLKGVTWTYGATLTDPPLLSGLAVDVTAKDKVTCTYKKQQTTEAGITPAEVEFIAPIKGKKADLTIEWNLGDAKWNTGRTPSFSLPTKGYKQITLDSLIESLNKQ